MANKMWILYDGRAESGDTFEASVLDTINSRKELRDVLYRSYGVDGVLAEYDIGADGKELINERIIGHMREGRKALFAKCSPLAHDGERNG